MIRSNKSSLFWSPKEHMSHGQSFYKGIISGCRVYIEGLLGSISEVLTLAHVDIRIRILNITNNVNNNRNMVSQE